MPPGLAKTFAPSLLDEAHRARILSANIIRLGKFGHPCARGILDHVAGVEDLFLAKATYDAACKRWPGKMIILRTGALVLEERQSVPARPHAARRRGRVAVSRTRFGSSYSG
jgi:hypothetical protein